MEDVCILEVNKAIMIRICHFLICEGLHGLFPPLSLLSSLSFSIFLALDLWTETTDLL